MSTTIKQAVLGCSQVLRYLRSMNVDHSKLTVFCIPSLRSSNCIVKVDLEWKMLHVHYTLTYFPTISDGLNSIKCIAIEQSSQFPEDLNGSFDDIILLHDTDFRSICGCSSGKCQQLRCQQSLLVKCEKGYMYKRLILRSYLVKCYSTVIVFIVLLLTIQ